MLLLLLLYNSFLAYSQAGPVFLSHSYLEAKLHSNNNHPKTINMKYEAIALLASLGLAAASPIGKIGYRPPRMLRGREVPQEHSHEQFITTVRASLATNNPDNIEDPIFGLLGSAAAAAGQGSISDVDCLHQATADQAFTNAKAAGDVDGMTAALIYAALERNTAAVGTASVLCTSIAATNPEIAAVSQHQVRKFHKEHARLC